MILRFKESDIQTAISKAEVDDDTFNDMLEEILGDEELAVGDGKVKEDAGFAEFSTALKKMNEATEAGSDEEVAKLHEQIDRAVRAEPEKGAED